MVWGVVICILCIWGSSINGASVLIPITYQSAKFFVFIFFTCPKKTNQKKGQPVTWSDFVGLPCAPRIYREFDNSPLLRDAHTDQTPFSVHSAVLGCVKWP
jgi:hypothetical protein